MTEVHPWITMPHVDNDTVNRLILLINTNKITPKGVYTFFHLVNLYLSEEQLRTIQDGCLNLYSVYGQWCGYDHALCCRVTDRWNLKNDSDVEKYYFCSENYVNRNSLPPHEWMPMTQFN